MKNNLTNKLIIVLSTMFILSSCGESIETPTDTKVESAVEEASELKAKGGETIILEGNSTTETTPSKEPIIN